MEGLVQSDAGLVLYTFFFFPGVSWELVRDWETELGLGIPLGAFVLESSVYPYSSHTTSSAYPCFQ